MDNADRKAGDSDKTEERDRKLADLFARIRAGDKAAEDQLLREYWDYVRVITDRSMRNRNLDPRVRPSDVFQSAMSEFVEVLHNGKLQLVSRQEVEERLSSLVQDKIRKHTEKHMAECRDFRREDKRTAAELDLPAREPGPAELAERADLLSAALQWLKPPDRKIYDLHLKGQPLGQIAAAVGRTVDAVRMRIGRCKQKLRAKFGLDGGTEAAG
jgi:RNA polymerase sigma factor (sigma-70 family)